jgi:hypothetical protein
MCFSNESQQMVLRNLIFQTEVVEQRFRTRVLSHHDQQASENGDPAKHGKESLLSSFYHASATTPLANHSDFFNTHA